MRNSGLDRVRMSPHVRYSMSVTALWWCGLYARFARVLPTVPEQPLSPPLLVACRSTPRCVWGADRAAATLGDAPIASVAAIGEMFISGAAGEGYVRKALATEGAEIREVGRAASEGKIW